ncbi:MAG: hypothetical protein IJ538_01090 [Clostridia bacterium]|nr:hypothetical protein [Clostridia bacterium]
MKKFWNSLTSFQKRYIPIFISIGIIFVLSIILIFTLPVLTHQILTSPEIKTKSGWPVRLAAPYIDMSSWVPTTNAYSINGAPDLGKMYDDTGVKFYNLGFIQPDSSKPLADDGNIRWGWGGYYSLSKNGSDGYQYNGIVESLTKLRKKGGDFTISIGGQLGDAPWVVTQNQTALENFYLDVIGTYELKRLDLDIEESNQDQDQNIINAKAIKSVQNQTDVQITLTIPIMPSGWQQKQLNIINAYMDEGVDIAVINSMTMCYGTGVENNEDYGTASVRAMNNAVLQLKTIYANHGYELTDDQAYLKLGATFSIGYESNLYPIFTLDMANTIVEDAKTHNYGLISMWSMNRDAMLESNSAISTKFNYTEILKKYNDDAT